MRALRHQRYAGPEHLTIHERERPRPGSGEVLVRVHASSLNAADWFMLTGRPWPVRFMTGLLRPTSQLLGLDVAGEVVAVGKGVASVAVGDAVFGEGRGAFAEYALVPEARLARKPAGVSFEDAATLPVAGCTALQGLRDAASLGPGTSVLVNGASGGVGSFAVQIARVLGASVTAVCSSANASAARMLGAAHVIDYRREDFSASTARYDAIFDLVGTTPLRACMRLLKPRGRFVSSAGRIGRVLHVALASMWPRSRAHMLSTNTNEADLAALAAMVRRGDVRPHIVRTCSLDELPAALASQGEGHARGKSVLSFAG